MAGNLWGYSYVGAYLTQVTNPNLEPVVQNHYDANTGRIDQQTDYQGGASATSSFVYTTQYTTVTDGRGNDWEYDWFLNGTIGEGALQSIKNPYGNKVKYAYDSDLNAQIVQTPQGTWTYGYDASFNVTSITPPIARYNVAFTYNGFGEPLTRTDGRGDTTTFVYDANGNLQCKILPTSGAPTCGSALPADKYAYQNNPDGSLASETDPDGHTTSYEYCPKLGSNPNGYCNNNDPAQNGLLYKVASQPSYVTTYYYNDRLQRVRVVTPQGNVLNCGTSCDAYTWTYGYDAMGNVTSVQSPMQSATQATTYVYDPSERLISVRDPRYADTNVSLDYSYQPGSDRPLVVAESGVQPGGGTPSTTYAFDGAGNLYTVRDANNVITTYGYSKTNQLTSVSSPIGNWTYSKYDFTSKSIQETLPSTNGQGVHDTITRSYDSVGHLTGISYSDGTSNVALAYDNAGNLSTVTDGGASPLSLHYDVLDQLDQALRSSVGFKYSTDTAGNLKWRQYPDGVKVFYKFDGDNRLCAVRLTSSTTCTTSSATRFAYNVGAGTVTKTYPNGIVATSSYDPAGRLTGIANTGATASSYQVTAMDAAGNPKTIVANPGGGLPTETQKFTYYGNERLKQVCYDSAGDCSGTTGLAGIAYTYDGIGDVLSQERFGATHTTTNYSYSSNQLVSDSSTTYTYDANGNRITGGPETYTFNIANEMKSATNGTVADTYAYDGLGNRVSDTPSSGNATTYGWDIYGSSPLLGTETQGSTTQRYTYADSLNSTQIGGGSESFFTHDLAGSVANVTSSSGAEQHSYIYDPLGGTKDFHDATGASANLMRLGSNHANDITHLYDLGARAYDPASGTFLQMDPTSPSPSYASVDDPSALLPPPAATPPALGAPANNPWHELGGPRMSNWEFLSLVLSVVVMFIPGPDIVGAVVGGTDSLVYGAEATAIGVGGPLNVAGGSLLLDEATGTIWDSIVPMGPVREGTSVPRSFILKIGEGENIWVHGNATKHLVEGIGDLEEGAEPVRSQMLLTSLRAAVQEANEQGLVLDKLIKIGGWELKFGPPRADGLYPVLFHARYLG
jgi:YD repeat-containing protein